MKRLIAPSVAAALLLSTLAAAPAGAEEPTEPVVAPVTSVDLALEYGAVYPIVDRYRDTVDITVSVATDGDVARDDLAGRLVIRNRDGRVMQTSPVTASGDTVVEWDGTNRRGKASWGRHTVSVSLTDGETVFADEATLRTVRKKLTNRIARVKVNAGSTLQACWGEDPLSGPTGAGCAVSNSDSAYGFSLKGTTYRGDVAGIHTIRMPKAARDSYKVRRVKVTANRRTDVPTKATRLWVCIGAESLGDCDYVDGRVSMTSSSKPTTKWVTVDDGDAARFISWAVEGTRDNSRATVLTYVVRVRYTVLA